MMKKLIAMQKSIAILLAAVLCLGTVWGSPERVLAAAVEETPIVVVLDPGHGGHDGGAARTWGGRTYREKTLNLAIAKYCREELEKYTGVKVYLTREDDTFVSLEGRVLLAERLNADVFVSLHNNADFRTSSRGASVFYPNSGYGARIGDQGNALAGCIEAQLTGIGLRNAGIHYRNSENHSKYPDQTAADYYQVIKMSKLCGFPGVIVEHAYVSNPSDCKSFLSTDAKIKQLGAADARGIAQYFGLVKGRTTTLKRAQNQQDGSVALTWTRAKGMDGYAVYRRVAGEGDYARIVTIQGDAATSYTDTRTCGGTTYEYCVRPYVLCSGTARCEQASNVQKVTSFAVPQNLTGKQMPEGQVKLAWNRVDGAEGYLVARRAGSVESYTVVADITSGTTLAWEDGNSAAQKGYEYQVCAYTQSGAGRVCGPYALSVKPVLAPGGNLLGSAAKEVLSQGTWQYMVEEGGVTVCAYTGDKTSLTIPEEIGGLKVTGIADDAFYNCYRVESIVVPASVVTVGAEAFAECSSLGRLVFQGTHVSIAENALNNCGRVAVWGRPDSGVKAFAEAAGASYSDICTYKVVYKLNGGTNSSKNPEYYNNYDGSVNLRKPTRSGYTFAGWYADAAGTTEVEHLMQAADGGKIAVYALWYKVPGQVKLKSAASRKAGQIQVTWKKQSAADGYVVYRSFRGGVWKETAVIEDGNCTSYTDSDVVSGMRYCYTVRAYTVAGGQKYFGKSGSTGVNAVCR